MSVDTPAQAGVSIDALLAAKEQRAARQADWLAHYQQPVISLTLVTPGAVKDSIRYRNMMGVALQACDQLLWKHRWQTLDRQVLWLPTGPEALWCVAHPASEIKAMCSTLKSGIGKVAAAMGATLLLERCQPDVIINTGSAGGLASTLKVGDIVVSDEARYHDADVTAFGYEYGQLPGCPAGFKADEKLVAAAESCIKALDLNAVRGLIVSGDAFINGSVGLAKIRHNFPQAIAVEMEATAIAHVCHNFKVPFVVVRAISDVADQQSHLSFEEFLAVAEIGRAHV